MEQGALQNEDINCDDDAGKGIINFFGVVIWIEFLC